MPVMAVQATLCKIMHTNSEKVNKKFDIKNNILLNKLIKNNILLINNQVLRKIKIAVKSDVKNWAYISLR